jgi:hypothetical protein
MYAAGNGNDKVVKNIAYVPKRRDARESWREVHSEEILSR